MSSVTDHSKDMNHADAGNGEVDIYRDTPIRLLGYANELGEAFRVWVSPFWVKASYGVASAYVVADTYDKGSKAAQLPLGDAERRTRVLHVSVDTLLWQALASVIIPGFTINRVCAATYWTLGRTALPMAMRKRLTTAAGLAVIPFIVKPIDTLVDFGLDKTFRKLAHISPEESQHKGRSH
ncbi:mitochondrial fission process protein 1-like isoform X2 [Pollicipes pollicipes]|nr:mitochondrial fission process protein 1-like isoform X2 [Pollicipes pollicipes]XP_037092178.1 mitochondrial fission process protein 1-like isoform X2 [Pollicipes pollicipes]XP_037092179.1 mitochondrial fission process protein 1-like isoform X2 [Pollicipes pollicipes]